jgi:hypothetical protein
MGMLVSPQQNGGQLKKKINGGQCKKERVRNDHVDKELRTYKTLAVYFDENRTLNHHVNYLTSKLSKALFMISRVKNILPAKALKTIYYALFHSRLLYCPMVVSCSSDSNMNKIVNYKKSYQSDFPCQVQ